KHEREFIDKNMIIFSNLFGPILAGYYVPNYKLKQGEKLGSFVIEKFYKEHFSDTLDELLEDEFTIDLRAGFYLKFYKPKVAHITMKFLKEGKVVSHWAKAYRGSIAKELAHYQPENEQELQKIHFENLEIKEIIKRKNLNEYIFDIV
ncbi:MAG TPA: peroxide stress protein YaaA, partial [Campylobacterales bacterium]|nr:peroxide stress protein YaaA [Campylobacterales bacterium]